MILTRKQEEGLKIVLDKHKKGDKYAVIAGYAGTGKSTLVKFIISALNVSPEKVAYATYTGKAAEVLRKKGNPGACTLHHLLYEHYPKASGGFGRRIRKELDYTVVVVDEVSMVPKSMVDLLMTHHIFIIFLGDPFQLPQIDKTEENDLLKHPDVFLDEVMRQAAESEIIRLTMKIRNSESIPFMKGNEVCVVKENELNTGMLTWADQILVATNATRHSINDQVRGLLGYSGLPKNGEKIICKRNYWDDTNENGDALVNGTTGMLINPCTSFIRVPNRIQTDEREVPIIIGDFKPDGGDTFPLLDMDRTFFTKEEPFLDWRVQYQLGKMKYIYGDLIPKNFTYAYAITCHSAQGSEWDKVLVIEESFPNIKIEHARWLYTAATRASEKLVIRRNE